MQRMAVFVCLGLVAAGGCAFVDQKARFDPDVRVPTSNVGAGRRVVIAVVDERPRSLIGRRGAGGSVGGAITTDQDLAELVRGKLAQGLQQYGFAPVSADGAEAPKMNVEVRFLEYELAMGFWTGASTRGRPSRRSAATAPTPTSASTVPRASAAPSSCRRRARTSGS
jgi:hypothetical protein